MILIVSYDLSAATDHSRFFESLKQQGVWWHYLTSTWLIATRKSPREVFQAIEPFMDRADRLLIFEVGKTYNGWLPKKAWEWIDQQQGFDAVRSLLPPTATPVHPTPPPPVSPAPSISKTSDSTQDIIRRLLSDAGEKKS
jgi:hypothetical protein